MINPPPPPCCQWFPVPPELPPKPYEILATGRTVFPAMDTRDGGLVERQYFHIPRHPARANLLWGCRGIGMAARIQSSIFPGILRAFGAPFAQSTVGGFKRMEPPMPHAESEAAPSYCFSKTRVWVKGLPSAAVPLAVRVIVFPSFEMTV